MTAIVPPQPGSPVSRRVALTTALAVAALPERVNAGTDQKAMPLRSGNATTMVSSFGVRSEHDGVHNTAALNAAILHVAASGGGTLIFDASTEGYGIIGPIVLPSCVHIDLNGQLLLGRRRPQDVLFVSGVLHDGEIRSNLGSAPETEIVTGAAVFNGRIEDCYRAFHLRNFGKGCFLRDIVSRNCVQFGRFERCFFLLLDSVSAVGFSDAAIPTFHFIDQTNAVTLRRLSAVTEYGLCIEDGASAVILDGYSFEGGTTAVRLIGDCLGMDFRGGYYEAVTGHAFDLRRAGVCSANWNSNYFNHVDTIFDDGGEHTTATLMGEWQSSNYVVSVPNAGFAKLGVARNLMKVSGPRNFVRFEAPYRNDAAPAFPDNWQISSNTRSVFESGQTGSSLTDIRTRSSVSAGTLPLVRSGDTGNPVEGTVPMCVVTTSKGVGATVLIDTAIAWRPATLFAKYILSVQDASGTVRLFGDIYGCDVVPHDKSGKLVRLLNKNGFVRLSIGDFDARASEITCTGSLQIV
ncbi:hypothetical protein [Sphingomonas phyllosphaerae]|uniref:hypothetical protein n=1 Tax=Sphingomonas phyllosphaerae TaxID=257003 RepID=UPI0024133382|nr:hypothetical protein [Sphingomonas phyllosphaerae]